MGSGTPARVRAFALDLVRHRLQPEAPRSTDPDAWVPLDAFVAELHEIDRTQGRGDGRLLEEAGRALIDGWALAFPTMRERLRGRPEAAVDVVLRHAMRYFLQEPPTVSRSAARRMQVSWPQGLPASFRKGLTEGASRLAGPDTTVRAAAPGSYDVTWRPPAVALPARLHDAVAAARLPFLFATLLPVLVATAIAAQDGAFSPLWTLLTIGGVAALHAGANALNDYYDHLSGADRESASPAPLVGGSRPLQRGLLAPAQLRIVAYAFYAVGVLVGLVLVAARGIEVLWVGLAGTLLGVLYSAPPVRLAHRGLGEIAIAVGFGPIIMMGTYFVQRQAWSLEALLASLPIAFLIAAVLYLNEFPDRQGDARVGKRTLIVRLPERPAVVLYVALLGLTYLVILGGVALTNVPGYESYAFPPWSLLGVLTLPLSARAALTLARNYRFPYRLTASNASTVLLHLSTGVLFAAGYFLPRVP